MVKLNRSAALLLSVAVGAMSGNAPAADWPQWRGANGDAKVSDFTPPATWPKTLAAKWKTSVGDGVSTPALVGDKLFVFARMNDNEVVSCLKADSGKEVWHYQYPSLGANGPAAQYSGPRSSPAVADGKVVVMGLHGMLTCLDAATGKKLWEKTEFKGSLPKFYTASSPILVDGVCLAQVGGGGNGGVVAYDLSTGNAKWTWTGDGPDYASPSIMTVGGAKLLIAETEQKIVAINIADGKPVWTTPFATEGPGAYNAGSPIVDGQTLIYSGGKRGTHAVKLQKEGDAFTAKELWSNTQTEVLFNSPIAKDGLIYGLTAGNEIFCINETTGKTAWTQAIGGAAAGGMRPQGGGGFGGGNRPGGGGRRGGRGGGMGGYGTILDAGAVLIALTPKSELVIFQPGEKAYTEVARIKVADSPTYAYPIVSGKRMFIKDQDSVSMLSIE